jgi:LysM repeat protein
VRRGDTLSKIAAKYHTTVARLAKANGIKNVNLIYVGQRLVIK